MEKTISIKRAEFMQRLASIIGQSQLQPCIIVDCLKLLTYDIEKLAEQQLQKELEDYHNAQANVQEIKEVDENVND